MAKKQGEEVFNQYFSSLYGERWPQIYTSLYEDDKKVARRNLFISESEFAALEVKGVGKPHQFLENCFEINDNFDLASIENKALPFYRMDPASIIAARALVVESGDRVLDMCAAPGGKSLILAEELFAAASQQWDLSGSFIANELSAKRRFRMMSVFKRYLPKEVRSRIEIKGVDGSLIGVRKKEEFDKILLDAPCSGERGVVQKASDLAQWKEKRSKSFGIRQYSLLSSAFMALKSGGAIVYSTCSISPHENDEVIRKLIKRKEGQFEIVPVKQEGPSESTEYGLQFLPDRKGWGPIYFCKLIKH